MLAEKIAAFVKRDLVLESSYRTAFIMKFAGMLLGVASFFFVSQLIGPAASPYLGEYGGDYFGFVLVGIAFVGFQGVGLTAFSSAISGAQSTGTLEAMLATPTRLTTIILASSVWSFLWTAFSVFVYLGIGGLIFGADLAGANLLSAMVVLVLTSAVFSGIGILSASTIMVLKRGDPIAWVFGSASAFLGGTYFPPSVFPDWLERVAHVFPIFYGLRAMRLAVLQGADLSTISGDVIVLAAFALVILPLSIVSFKAAVRIAKTDGTLATY